MTGKLRSKPESTTTTAAEPSATDACALGRDPGESARLQRQSGELRSDSTALLDRVGLRPGQSAIDLGCGPSGIIELLAERVAPGGRVVGTAADRPRGAPAREHAKLLDLQMLVIGGRERTYAEYHSLLHDAGYELTPIVPTSASLHIIEGIAR